MWLLRIIGSASSRAPHYPGVVFTSVTQISPKRKIFLPHLLPIFNHLLLNHIMSKSYNDQERDIQKTLNHHKNNPSLKFTKLAELYDIPYHRLITRAKNRDTR